MRIRVLVRAKVGNDLFYALHSKRFSIRPQELTNDTLSVPKMFAHAQLPAPSHCAVLLVDAVVVVFVVDDTVAVVVVAGKF